MVFYEKEKWLLKKSLKFHLNKIEKELKEQMSIVNVMARGDLQF